MKRLAQWLVVCLAALGALAPLRESVAAEKVDLEDYIGVPPLLNDNKTFLATGDDYTDTAIDVQSTPKQITVLNEQTYSDEPGSSVRTVQGIVPGKKLLQGTLTMDDGNDQIVFATAKPKKLVLFQLVPNKPYKFKIPYKVSLNGFKAGKGVEYGTYTFLGFEDVVTPLGTFEHCAHLKATDNLRLGYGRKDSLEVKDQIETWEAAGIGSVRFIQSEDVYENGVLDPSGSTPPTEFFFDHGVINGEPIGPPEPMGGASASASARYVPIQPAQVVHMGGASAPAAGGIDVVNAGASVVTQEFIGLSAAPDASVGTRASGTGITYLQGMNYSRAAGADANAP